MNNWVRSILAGIGAVVVVSFLLSHLSSGGGGSTGTTAVPLASSAAGSLSASANQIITYTVTDTPGDADVSYGPAGTKLNGKAPMSVTVPLKNASYYAVYLLCRLRPAQRLGKVACSISVDGKAIGRGNATGGYNIA
jgi:hypothetical protein